jgi:hypothetical protein
MTYLFKNLFQVPNAVLTYYTDKVVIEHENGTV